jgi:hypothetical protein
LKSKENNRFSREGILIGAQWVSIIETVCEVNGKLKL